MDNKDYFFIFAFIWFFSCIFWPIWALPRQVFGRFLFFSALLLYVFVNLIMLSFWFPKEGKKRHIDNRPAKRTNVTTLLKDKILLFFLAFLSIFILINLLLIKLPIPLGDNVEYLSGGIAFYKISSGILSKFTDVPLNAISWTFLLLIILSYYSRSHIKKMFDVCYLFIKRNLVYLTIPFILLLYLYFYVIDRLIFGANNLVLQSGMVADHVPFYEVLNYVVKRDLLNKIINGFAFSLFGYNEWSARIPLLIFSILTAIFLYKLVRLYKDKATSMFASLLFLFIPGFFYFTHIANKTTGLIFFMTASSYFILKYQKYGKIQDIFMFAILFNLGYLYKEALFFLMPAVWIYLFLDYLIRVKKINMKTILDFLKSESIYIKFTWVSLVPVVLWILSDLLFVGLYSNQFRLSYFSIENLFKYVIYSMPYNTTFILYFIFIIAFFYALYLSFRKGDRICLFSLTLFFTINLVFAFNDPIWGPYHRYYVPALIGAAVIISVLINDLINLSMPLRKIKYALFAVIISLLIINIFFLTTKNLDEQYIPFDQTFRYIKNNIPSDKKILSTMGPNPYKFYIEKHQIMNIFDHTKWILPYEKQNLSNLYDYCIKNKIDYVIFPYPLMMLEFYYRPTHAPYLMGEGISSGTWLYEAVNPQLVIEMSKNEDDYFSLIKTFEFGKNKMFIFEVKQGPFQ